MTTDFRQSRRSFLRLVGGARLTLKISEFDLRIGIATNCLTEIAEYLQNRGGTLISITCGSGRKPLANAFFKSGYRTYIAPGETYADTDSALVFIVNLFYQLMAEDREYATTIYTEQEAAEKAALLDPDFCYGIKLFRCYTTKETT